MRSKFNPSMVSYAGDANSERIVIEHDRKFAAELEAKIGRKLTAQETFEGRLIRPDNRTFDDKYWQDSWNPKSAVDPNASKFSHLIGSPLDRRASQIAKIADVHERISAFAQLAHDRELAQRGEVQADAPAELAQLEEHAEEIRFNPAVSKTEEVAVAQAIAQCKYSNACPVETKRKVDEAAALRKARYDAEDAAWLAEEERCKALLESIKQRRPQPKVTAEPAEDLNNLYKKHDEKDTDESGGAEGTSGQG